MTKSLLHIAYDGPALEDGTMDVRELAPALLAIGETIERTAMNSRWREVPPARGEAACVVMNLVQLALKTGL